MARPMLEMAVKPRTAYPVAYTPFKDKAVASTRKQRDVKNKDKRQSSLVQKQRRQGQNIILPLTITHVPHQMPDPVPRMQRERNGQRKLDRRLQPSRHPSDKLDQVSAVDGGEDGVEEESQGAGVEEAGEGGPGDSVEGGEDPGELSRQRI
jgi:hypothetical protein